MNDTNIKVLNQLYQYLESLQLITRSLKLVPLEEKVTNWRIADWLEKNCALGD